MPVVKVQEVTKQFKIRKRNEQNQRNTKLPWYRRLLPTYELITAVSDLSFEISRGEIVGLIGLNGSGKSTTIKLITGILSPTKGTVRVFGLDPIKHRMKTTKRFGVMFGQRSLLWYHLPAFKSLLLYKEIYQLSKKEFHERVEWLSDVLKLEEFLHRPVRSLSLGQRMRVELAAAMIHFPELLILDEPFIGLDFMVKNQIRKFLLQLNQKDDVPVTILIADHDLVGIEDICDRLLLLHRGRLLDDVALLEFKARAELLRRIECRGTPRQVHDAHESLQGKVEWSDIVGNILRMTIDTQKISIDEVITHLEKKEIKDFHVSHVPLQDILRLIYRQAGIHENS